MGKHCPLCDRHMYILLIVQLWMFLMVGEYEGRRAFKVEFMKWAEFRDVVIDPESHVERWDGIAEMDCIVGGIDYAADPR